MNRNDLLLFDSAKLAKKIGFNLKTNAIFEESNSVVIEKQLSDYDEY